MTAHRIVPAASADAPLLLDMMQDFNRLEHIAWSRRAAEPALRRLLEDASLGLVALLQENGRTLGYCVLTWGYDLEWNGRDAFITELYLQPAERGRGLGRRFLTAIEQLAKQREVNALHLMVRPENEAALKLYTHAGYEAPPRTFLTRDLRQV